ncbi:LacI family DNA-binding transcriptional regulator [Heyndrickxia acidicola]|uniref:LacI family DNA-binding transcriptional regulator n=1 Tax=Heyndrickxia acidicola TaxID=209389 RepID=A0ABU6MG80_9BACI|nr:LacI family DNA-binding transcriptional regulator [Heyndrickxia acidicola]MED1203695.1 LacI family DNA-binding transcriptional regulator [Heyndrickxia acidicola]
MANIKDIAKKAGVSISTVSYALNGSSKITEETTERIVAIAKELNYIPNAAGRNLKKKETKIIGTFIEDYTGSFFGPIFKGMREALSSKGYELIVCSGVQSHRFIPEKAIDGAIILDVTFSSEELLNYAERGHKLVVLDREVEHPNINQVLLDNKAGAAMAIDYIMEKGHQKLYVLPGRETIYDAKQRLQAVREAIKRYPHINYIEFEGGADVELATEQMIKEYTQPAAVFCFNDETAIGMYNYLAGTKYHVGEHIHIVGFDNIDLAAYMQPRLATIDFSRYNWGYLAAENLLKMIANEEVEPKLIDVTLIEGKSVQAYPRV